MNSICSFTLVASILAGSAIQAVASGLVPVNMKELVPREVYLPLPVMYMNFSYKTAGDSNAKATIYCGDEIVYQARLIYGNSSLSDAGPFYGYAIVYADPDFTLPKGKKYRLNIPAGCVWRVDNPDISLDEINCEFEVPSYHKGYFYDGEYLEKFSEMYILFSSDIELLPGAEFRFYREDEYIRSYGCWYCNDLDTGTVTTLNEKGEYWKWREDSFPLEPGIRYKLVLPANSVCAAYRKDIRNKEEVINFIGGPRPEEASIDVTTDDNGVAGWYTIQGRAISRPETPGIYIMRRKDGTTTKHIIH